MALDPKKEQRNVDQKDVDIFVKHYKRFMKRCLEDDIIPIPQLKVNGNGIVPYIDFRKVNAKEKAEISSKFKI